jgi:hypothetical protein
MLKAHFGILGISENATKAEVIRAHRAKALQDHPDKRNGSDAKMKLINEARTAILNKLESSDTGVELEFDANDERINAILSGKVFDDLDDPSKRISKSYEALHAKYTKQYRQENKVEYATGISYFEEFETSIYDEVELDGENVSIEEFDDLFDMISKKEWAMQECMESIDSSQVLTPQIAINHCVWFIEGKYFGDKLKQVQQLFKNRVSNVSTIDEYNLYSGILGLISMKGVTSGNEGELLSHLNQITEYIRVNVTQTAAAMPAHLAMLLQNVYFRTLFAYALHLDWLQQSRNFNPKERASLSNASLTYKHFRQMARQILAQEEDANIDEDLIHNAAYLKRLYEFERFSTSGVNAENSADWSRERGYDTLNWLNRLMPFVSRNVLINILIQAGMFFQEASICARQEDQFIAKADQRLAFQAYLDAVMYAKDSAPDLEIYALSNALRYIAAFRFRDEEIQKIVSALQERLLQLVDIFPICSGLHANIDFLTGASTSNLAIMRSLLHALVEIGAVEESIDHDKITVLYHVYEACVRSWYTQNYDPELENKFRLELMELLLARNNWSFSDINNHLISPVMIRRDADNWLEMGRPLRIVGSGMQTYASLEGLEIDPKTGTINFMLSSGVGVNSERGSRNTFTIYDLMEMLEKNITGAFFSLDPVDPKMRYHPFNAMRFAPADIYQTQFLNTMLLADYVLKFLTIGAEVQGAFPYDMRSITDMVKRLPKHLQNIINNFHAAQGHKSGAIHRFWIEAEEISSAITQDEESSKIRYALTDVKMILKKHTMRVVEHGNLVDTDNDDEGWTVYILTPQQYDHLSELTINGPAMLFVPEYKKICFFESDHIYKEVSLSLYHAKEIGTLSGYQREENGKVIVTTANSFLIYRLVSGIAAACEVPSHFSPEYVFAQEFTAHYDEFSEYFLIFARLRELSKMTAAIGFLNIVQAGAIERKVYYSRLLQSLPDWEQRDSHPSTFSNYLDNPKYLETYSPEEQAQIMFRVQHAEKIRSLLPRNLFNQNLEKLAPLAEQIRNGVVNINSPEIDELCNKVFEENRTTIINQYGRAAWEDSQDRIWKKIQKMRPEYVRQINEERQQSARQQLRELFTKNLSASNEGENVVSGTRMSQLVESALCYDMRPYAEELSKYQLHEAKKQIRHMLLEQERVLGALRYIGLASEEKKHIKLDDQCLWVPASVRHHVNGNNSLFVYGGVRVAPKVNSINPSNPKHAQTLNNAFAQNRATVNNGSIAAANNRVNASNNNQRNPSNNQTGGGGGGGGRQNRNGSSLPKTRKELHEDLVSRGFKFHSETARDYSQGKGGGIVTYKGPDGRIATIKNTGEVILVQKKWTADSTKKYPERQDYYGGRLSDQSHNTGHFVEPFMEPAKPKVPGI